MVAKILKPGPAKSSGGSDLLFCLHPTYNFNASFRLDNNSTKRLSLLQRDFERNDAVAATKRASSLLQTISSARDSLAAGLAHNTTLNDNLETYNEQVQLILAAPTKEASQMMAREQLLVNYKSRMIVLQRILPENLREPIIASFKQAIVKGATDTLEQHVHSATEFAKSKRIRGIWKEIEEVQKPAEDLPPCDWQQEKAEPRDIKPLGRTRSKSAKATNAMTAQAPGCAAALPANKGGNTLARAKSTASTSFPKKDHPPRDPKRHAPRHTTAGNSTSQA